MSTQAIYVYGPRTNIGHTVSEVNGRVRPFDGTYYESGMPQNLDYLVLCDDETSITAAPTTLNMRMPVAVGMRETSSEEEERLQAKASLGLSGILEPLTTLKAGYGYNGFMSFASSDAGTYVLYGSAGVGTTAGTLYGCGIRPSATSTTGYEGFVTTLGAGAKVLCTIPDTQILQVQAVDNDMVYCISQPVDSSGVPTQYTYALHSADGTNNYDLFTFPGDTWKGGDVTYGANRFFMSVGNTSDCVVSQQCDGGEASVTNKVHLLYKMRGAQGIHSVSQAWTTAHNTVGNPVSQDRGGSLQYIGVLLGNAQSIWTFATPLSNFETVSTYLQPNTALRHTVANMATQSLWSKYSAGFIFYQASGTCNVYEGAFNSNSLGGFVTGLPDVNALLNSANMIGPGQALVQILGGTVATNGTNTLNPLYYGVTVVLYESAAGRFTTASLSGPRLDRLAPNRAFTAVTFPEGGQLSTNSSLGQVFVGGTSLAQGQQLQMQLNFVAQTLAVLPGRDLPPLETGLSVTKIVTPGGVSYYVAEDRTFHPFGVQTLTAAVTQLVVTVTGGNATANLPDTVQGWSLSQNGLPEAATYKVSKTALDATAPTEVLHAFQMTVADNVDVPSQLHLSVGYLAPEQAQPDTSGQPITASTLTGDGQEIVYTSYNNTGDESTVYTAELDAVLGLRLPSRGTLGTVAGKVLAVARVNDAFSVYATVSSGGTASLVLVSNTTMTTIDTLNLVDLITVDAIDLEAMSDRTVLLSAQDDTPEPYLQLVTIVNSNTLAVTSNPLTPAQETVGRPIVNDERTAAFVSVGKGEYIYQIPAAELQGSSTFGTNMNSNPSAFTQGTSDQLSLSQDYLYQPNGNTVRRIPLQNWSSATNGWEVVVTLDAGLAVSSVVANGMTGYAFASSDGGTTSKLYHYDTSDPTNPQVTPLEQVSSYTAAKVQTLRQEQFVFHSDNTIGVVGSRATSGFRLYSNLGAAPTPTPTPNPTTSPGPTSVPPQPTGVAPTTNPTSGGSKAKWQHTVYGTGATAAVLLAILIWLIVLLIRS